MPLTLRAVATAGVVASLIGTSRVAAADPTKQECVDSNERAQALRQQASLRAARAELAVCLASSCPGPVRQDCADRIAEIDHALPTVVFEVKDAAGHDLPDVSLRVDGKVESSGLDGTAVALDPGTHEVAFVTREGFATKETMVIHEGEKDRREAVVLDVVALATARSGRAQREVGITLAGAGLAGVIVGGVFGIVAKTTYDSALSGDCHGSARTCDSKGVSQVNSAHSQAAGATVGVLAGAALLASGVALWVTSRRSVSAVPTTGGATLQLGGSF